METIEVKTSELIGSALDWAVAQAVGVIIDIFTGNRYPHVVRSNNKNYAPSTDWAQGGPLIESWQIFIDPPQSVHTSGTAENGKRYSVWQTYESWHATVSARVCKTPPKFEGFPGGVGRGEGDGPLLAACRAIVAAKLGESVQVPKELIEVKP